MQKNGYTFAIVYSSKCVSVFLHQTLVSHIFSKNRYNSFFISFSVKQNCRTCDQVLAELENIDDETDDYGILMVKLNDPALAKRYGIKTFPSLVYFRNGNPLTFDGK